MALGAAMVDLARVYTRQQVAAGRVEGSTQYVDAVSAWAKARLTIPQAPEAVDSTPRGRRRVAQVPTLMVLAKDKAGEPVQITTDTRIGVVSKQQFGEGVEVFFRVTADPEPIRKKRTVLGYTAALERVVDHALQPVAGV